MHLPLKLLAHTYRSRAHTQPDKALLDYIDLLPTNAAIYAAQQQDSFLKIRWELRRTRGDATFKNISPSLADALLQNNAPPSNT